MIKFETGTTYTARSIGDLNCVFEFTVTKRTARFVTLSGEGQAAKRCKIKIDVEGPENVEFAFPFGRYSMAPVIKADRVKS